MHVYGCGCVGVIVVLVSTSYSAMCVAGKKMVKVLRLREPVRGGQTTLD